MRTVSWRYIFFLLSFIGVFATCAIFGMLFWMVARIDKISHEKTQALLELKIGDSQQSLMASVEDYAYWTLAYQLVQSGDRDALYENIGSGAAEGGLFDQLFISDAQGDLLFAYDKDHGQYAREYYHQDTLAPILQGLRAQAPENRLSSSSLVNIDGTLSLVSMAWITPDSYDPDQPIELPVLIGVVHFDADMLATTAKNAQVAALEILPHGTQVPLNGEKGLLDLFDLDGHPLVTLCWVMPSQGAEIRNELLPGVLIMALGILGVCAVAARYFHRQHDALETANLVATTDQLTGLLNRAGLAKRQENPDIKRALEKGHLAAIYLDLNEFKQLNDTHGHMAGDLALRVTAERMRSAVRKTDVVARLGGDEFVCIINDPHPETTALYVADRILEMAETPVNFEDHTEIVTPAVGVAISTPGMQWETIISQSDAAMYWSKQKKSQSPVIFCKSMDGTASFAAQ